VRKGTLRTYVIVAASVVASTFLCGCSTQTKLVEKPPVPPVAVRPAIVSQGLAASWDAAPGATHYTLFWGKDKGEFSHFVDVDQCYGVITGLSKGEVYHLAVTAWNNLGESDYSALTSVVYDDSQENAPRHLARGDSLVKQGRFEDAETYYSAAIRLSPADAEAYRKRGELYRRIGKVENAQRDIENAERVAQGKSANDRGVKMAGATPSK
jgi:tetratricopeptide (TPR) repeat protein